MKATTIFYEYNRESDKSAPNKIAQISDYLDINTKYSTKSIVFTLGINSKFTTCCRFDCYMQDDSSMHLEEIAKMIKDDFLYIQDAKLLQHLPFGMAKDILLPEAKELEAKLDFILPRAYFQDDLDRINKIAVVVGGNPEWVARVTDDPKHSENKLTDIIHDIEGICTKDKHFLPRL